jgi:dephospho-CoA kinase
MELEVSSSKRADRFIIGLTGNIGTGKSLVRRMLESLGAYGIDGDLLAYKAALQESPGYRQIIAVFGEEILCPDGPIDRKKLGRIVFSDPALLQKLEAIIHPLVLEEINRILLRYPSVVHVIEAIKLLEANLGPQCDSIWVTTSDLEIQHKRLTRERGMSEEIARQRINAQSDPALKIKAADVVITNNGSIEDVWRQVADAWNHHLSRQIASGLVLSAIDQFSYSQISGLYPGNADSQDALQ